MIKIENVDVFGWESAIRGMRNPLNSWNKSDSSYGITEDCRVETLSTWVQLGENDLKLMKTLAKAGPDHGKFLRYINVTLDINAPLYWWKEFDTYKVGTVANSCSTMHKLTHKQFELDDFSHDKLNRDGREILKALIYSLNAWRDIYLEDKDKESWWQMIQLLPSSYNQKRTVQLNYQVLKSMYFARRHHKLDEWHDFCAWCETLPYFKEICIQEGE